MAEQTGTFRLENDEISGRTPFRPINRRPNRVILRLFAGARSFRVRATSTRSLIFSDFIETGTSAQQAELTIRLRRRDLPSVKLVSRRAWCRESGSPRSREASGSNPRLPTGSNHQILSHALSASANAGERDTPAAAKRWVGLVQSGCEAVARRFKSPGGTRTKAARPFGCKARQVRLTHAGVGSFPVATPRNRRMTTSGVLPQKQTVKSSTMRGAQALASKPQQRRSQIGKRLARAGRSSLLYSNDRNQRVVARWKLCRSGSFGHAWQARTHCRPTNVTAVVKNRNNRARSVASGVVSGAGLSTGDSNAAL